MMDRVLHANMASVYIDVSDTDVALTLLLHTVTPLTVAWPRRNRDFAAACSSSQFICVCCSILLGLFLVLYGVMD